MTDTSKKYEAVNTCSDYGTPIGHDDGPSDGWQLERGRTVCHRCCAKSTKKLISDVVTKPRGLRIH